tara:strand:+ start:107 stop:613 length:507 start_codon:yes stop_codon:yes gene_type:complete
MALQIAPLIVPERRILISLYLFMPGILPFHLLPSIAGLGAAIYARHFVGHDRGLFILVALTVCFALAKLKFARHDQPKIKHGVTADIQGTLIKIDGNADARSRLWISLDVTSKIVKSGMLPAGGIVRVTTDKWQEPQYLSGAIAMREGCIRRPTVFCMVRLIIGGERG